MVILSENLFRGATKWNPSFLGIYPNQARNDGDAIVSSAGWYNQVGEFLSSGDLSANDLIQIQIKIADQGFGPFIVVPKTSDLPWAPVMDIKTLAECCVFIVHPSFLYVLDPRYRWQEWGYVSAKENPMTNIVFHSVSRREAYNLIASLTLQ